MKITVRLTNRDTSNLFKNDIKQLLQTMHQPSIIYRQPLTSKSMFLNMFVLLSYYTFITVFDIKSMLIFIFIFPGE